MVGEWLTESLRPSRRATEGRKFL